MNIKNCISKLSIKMFIQRKTRARRAHANQMLLIFKMSVTNNLFLTSRRTTVFLVKLHSSDISRYFAGHCPMSGVNF